MRGKLSYDEIYVVYFFLCGVELLCLFMVIYVVCIFCVVDSKNFL